MTEFYQNRKNALAFVDKLAQSKSWVEIRLISFQVATQFGVGERFAQKRIAELEEFNFVQKSTDGFLVRAKGAVDEQQNK
jgi:hypothetical protein